MAVRFDSDADWISLALDIGGAGHVNFTLEGWFYLEEYNDSAGILTASHGGNGRAVRLLCDNDFPTPRVALGDSQTGQLHFTAQPPLNTWVFLQLSSPNTTGGTLTGRWSELGSDTVNTVTRTNGVEASVQAQQVLINRKGVGDANGFTGGLRAAYVRGYTGPSSESEFLARKTSTAPTGALFWWDLDDNTDTADQTGNGRTATFNGALTTAASPDFGPPPPAVPALYYRKFPELAPEAGDAAWADSDPASVILRAEFFGAAEAPASTFAATEGADTAALSGTVVVSGALAGTEGADTAALSGTVRSIATLASTEANDTASSGGSAIAGGPLAGLEAADAFAADGEVTTASGGSLAATEASDTAALPGTIIASGPLAASEIGDTASASGSVLAVGSLTTSEAGDALAATGTVRVSGPLAASEGGDSAAIAGSVRVSGALGAVEGADTFAAVGDGAALDGTLSTTESADALAASGAALIAGAIAASEVADTALLSGSVRTTGDLVATESGGDTAAVAGSILIAGVLAASELADIFAAVQGDGLEPLRRPGELRARQAPRLSGRGSAAFRFGGAAALQREEPARLNSRASAQMVAHE